MSSSWRIPASSTRYLTTRTRKPRSARGVEQVGKGRQNLLADLTIYRIVIPAAEHVVPEPGWLRNCGINAWRGCPSGPGRAVRHESSPTVRADSRSEATVASGRCIEHSSELMITFAVTRTTHSDVAFLLEAGLCGSWRPVRSGHLTSDRLDTLWSQNAAK